MSYQATKHVRDLDPTLGDILKGTDRAVLFVLATYHDHDLGYAWPGIKKVAAKAWVSEATARRSVRRCADAGVLHIEPRQEKGDRSHRYRFPGIDVIPEGGVTVTGGEGVSLIVPGVSDCEGGTITQVTGGDYHLGDTLLVIEKAMNVSATPAASADDDGSPLSETAAPSSEAPRDAAGVVQRVRGVLDRDQAGALTPDHAATLYVHAYDVAAPAGAEKYAAVPGVDVALIRAAVIDHAGQCLMTRLTPSQLQRLHTVVTRFGSLAFGLMPRAASRATKDPVAYLRRCCEEHESDAGRGSDVLSLVSNLANSMAAS